MNDVQRASRPNVCSAPILKYLLILIDFYDKKFELMLTRRAKA